MQDKSFMCMYVFSGFNLNILLKGNFRIDAMNKSVNLFPNKTLTEESYLEFKQNHSETLKIVQRKWNKLLKAQVIIELYCVSKNGWLVSSGPGGMCLSSPEKAE